MKKIILSILLISLLISNVHCGSGGTGSSNESGKTKVNISLGKAIKAVSGAERLSKETSYTPDIPANVYSIRFTISASDIITIVRLVTVAGKTSISETFDILNGTNRDFLIEVLDDSGHVLYNKETFVNLEGTPVHLTIELESADLISPVFSGLSDISSVTDTSLRLSWSAGDDNLTPQSKIQYLIYVSDTTGGENFASPSFSTGAGDTSFSVTGLNPDTAYYFVVRAKDENGNIETNSIETPATTLSPPDTTPPVFDGVVSVTAVSSTELSLSWYPAADNVTVSENIVYNIYLSETAGGEGFASPDFTTNPGETSFRITGLTMGATYYVIVRAKDEAGNIDNNMIEQSATTQFIDLTAGAELANPCAFRASCPEIVISVPNNGNIDANDVQGYYVHENCNIDGCFGNICESILIPLIGAQTTGQISYPRDQYSTSNYYIIIDPGNTIPETNEANNIACSGSFCASPPSLDVCLLR